MTPQKPGLKCLLDLDGVLADFVGGVYKLRGTPRKDPMNWDFIEAHEWEKMDEEFWASLDKTPEFDALLSTVEETFGPENICLLTSPVRTAGCLEGKMRWIREHLPAYSRRFLIGPAKEFCAHPRSVLIDDSETNTRAFFKAGGNAVLVPREWNQRRGQSLEKTLAIIRPMSLLHRIMS